MIVSDSYSQSILPAQLSGTLKGTVTDSISKNSLSHVTIVVTDPLTGQQVKSTSSNIDGSFTISSLPYKRLEVILTSVGYSPKIVQLPSFTSSIIFIGNIALAPVQKQLNDVVVVSRKPLIESDHSKIIYNVSADPDGKTGSAFDIMRKVPRLTVDGEDKLQVNGSTSYRVLINGRTSALFVRNPSDVLKTMPANLIMKIEVITNPPARYEAEGIGGLINIITFKKRIDGYNGAVTAGFDNIKGPNIGGYVTAKNDKFGMSVNAGSSINRSPVSSSTFIRRDRSFSNSLHQNGESRSNNSSVFLSGDVSYDIDSLNLITAGFSLNTGRSRGSFFQNVELRNANDAIIQSYKNNNANAAGWKGSDIGLDYQRSFKNNADRLLTLSYKFTNNNNNGRTSINQKPLLNYYRNDSYSRNGNSFNEQTFQADYVQPVKKNILEVGVKSISRKNNSNYSYSIKDSNTGRFVNDPRLGNNFDNTQVIDAAYASFTTKSDDWAITAGTRVEATKTNATFKTSGTVASQHHVNVLPNVLVSRQFKGSSSISLSYSQRIERPGIFFLDPFIDISDPRNIYYGNPDLSPAISNQFNLSHFTFIKTATFNTNVFYYFSSNSIERFTSINKDTTAYTTYGNIGKNKSFGGSVSTNFTLIKKLNIALSNTTSYTSYSSLINGSQQNNDGVTMDAFFYATYRFNANWRSGASINYNSASVFLQGSQAGFVSNNFSVNKEILNKKGTLGLTVNNPFRSRRIYYRELKDPGFYQLQQSQFVIRSFMLAFNYRFGELKDDISRKKRGIKNDDLKTGG